ncbi:MAG: hypothetical protein K0U40_00705 [Betaproteobacteria bacterium]|nr:hypothetical protein [Betaproteobacteria bacterium]
MVRQIVQTGIAVFILITMLYTGTVGAHGKVEMEDDSCMRRVGENMIHMSIYQPQVDIEGHYCTNVPQAGNAVLVIDLVDPALREMPIGIKIIRGSNEEDGEVIANMRPTMYQDGVINTQKMLEQGKHLLVVTADGFPPLSYRYHLRVEMINYEQVFRASIGPVVGILLTLILGYKILRSRRFRNWLAAKRGIPVNSEETNGGKENDSHKTKHHKSSSNEMASGKASGSGRSGNKKADNTAGNTKTSDDETSESKINSSETDNGNKTSK